MNCKNCGACCRILPIAINSLSIDEQRVINARLNTEIAESNGITYIVFKSPCRYLTAEKKCRIHQRKFDFCKNFKCGGDECLFARNIDVIK